MLYASTQTLGMLDLLQDPLFAKLDPAEYPRCIAKGISAGTAAAAHCGCDPEVAFVSAGFEIRRLEDPLRPEQRSRIQAQIFYETDKPHVDLHMAELSHKQSILAADGLTASLEWMVQLHLAHEYYHFLEFSQSHFVGDGLVPARLHGLVRPRRLRAASEIAAHSFSDVLMDSPLRPELMDYLVLIADGLMTQEEFSDLLARAQIKLSEGKQHG
jgi:hypothetical protein